MNKPTVQDIKALIEQAEKLKQEVEQLNKKSFLTQIQREAVKASTDTPFYLLRLNHSDEETCNKHFGLIDHYFSLSGSVNRGRFALTVNGIEYYNPEQHGPCAVRCEFDDRLLRDSLNQYTATQRQSYREKHIQPLIVQLDTDLTPWLPFMKPYIDTEGIQKAIKTAESKMLSDAIYQFKKVQKVIETEAKRTPVGTEQETESQEKDGQSKTNIPDYKALNLANRTIKFGTETYNITSEKVWDFLKDLYSALRDDRLVPMLEGSTNNKNNVDQLRKKISNVNLHKLIIFVNGGYKLNPEVKILKSGQIGIRKTHLSRKQK